MESCSLHHWILFFIILIPVADVTETSLTAKLHHPVTLTCNQKCSGMMTWKTFDGYVLAYCDQLSCNSGEGFEISFDQYLKGNLDVIIRSVDFSKRTIYTCYCDDKAVCNVHLIIEPLVSAVQKKPGEDLVLDLHIPELMEVVYKHGESICSVTAGSLQCGADYKQRASLNHTELTLRDLKVSDSGVYTIRDMKNKEVLHKYVVSVVEETQPHHTGYLERSTLVVVVVVVVCLMTASFVCGLWVVKHHKEQSYIRKIRKQMAQVDELIERYSNRDNRLSQTTCNTVEKILIKKKAEMDELMQKCNNVTPEMNTLINQWTSKMAQLYEIIMEYRREMIELQLKKFRAVKQWSSMRSDSTTPMEYSTDQQDIDFSDTRRPKSEPEDCERATPEDFVELNPSEQDQPSFQKGKGGEEEEMEELFWFKQISESDPSSRICPFLTIRDLPI